MNLLPMTDILPHVIKIMDLGCQLTCEKFFNHYSFTITHKTTGLQKDFVLPQNHLDERLVGAIDYYLDKLFEDIEKKQTA